jgi:magnesium chelatase subunit D
VSACSAQSRNCGRREKCRAIRLPASAAVSASTQSPGTWQDAVVAAALFAVDPIQAVGVVVRAHAGPVRTRWMDLLLELLPAETPMRRVPVQVGDDRLLGGIDLTATLRAGRPVAERGLLAEADGGLIVLPMAERISGGVAARISAVLDTQEVVLERDGLGLRTPARFGVLLLDEGVSEDEQPPAALLDRLSFRIDLGMVGIREAGEALHQRADVIAARRLLPSVSCGDEAVETLCAVADALGIASVRAPLLALRTARAAAALDGRERIAEDDLILATRVVLMPRATRLPAQPAAEEPPAPPPPQEDTAGAEDQSDTVIDGPLAEQVIAAAQAVMPAEMLARLAQGMARRSAPRSHGSSGQSQQSTQRGRPIGARRGVPQAGSRINVIETLRAAAPWQPIRRREAAARQRRRATGFRLHIHQDDLRVTRYRQRTQTTAIFAVDASGSSALHRLAEAKGAVELLLADCYVRRDQVALVAFRGQGAELLLPPTRSLVRAKRSLAALPGGGGTPLAAGINTAFALAESVRGRGQTPLLIVLTDGRANVALDPTAGRAAAEADAMAAARRVREAGVSALMVDTSPRPNPQAAAVAAAMNARYLPLPHADAAQISRAILASTG